MKVRQIAGSLVLCTVLVFSSVLFGMRTYAYGVTDFTAMGIVTTTSTSLNVRSGPGTEYEAIQSVNKDAVINITGITEDVDGNEWYRLNINGYVGYVFKQFVTLVNIPETPDEAFELSIEKFPESYKEKLRLLHALHPTWKFTPLETGITWADLIKNQRITGTNLVQSPNAWKSFDDDAYDWEDNTWYTFDSGGWAQACTEVIEYYLDPRNFLDSNVYQFLVLSDDGSEVKPEVINEILKGTFMYNKECDEGVSYAKGIILAGKEAGASPYMLAARLLLEQGASGNSLAHGYEINGVKYYNHFDIGAYRHSGNSAIYNGAVYAKSKGWDTAYKALVGGAQFLVKSYVSVGQNTLYLQKYDVVDYGNGFYGHQYMTNVAAAVSECATLRNAIEGSGADEDELNFLIPVYLEMPDKTASLPLKTGNANNLLSSLTVNGKDVKFDKYTFTYEVFTDETQIEVKATPSNKEAVVSGVGKILLEEGINEITVTVTATNGLKRDYKIIISTSAEKDFTVSYDSTIDRIKGVESNLALSDFKTKIETKGYTVKYLDAKGNEKAQTDNMKTGDSVVLYFEDNAERTMQIVVYGDSSGDGRHSLADLLQTQSHILGNKTLEGAFFEAADINKDNRLSLADLLQCQKIILES